MIGPAAVWKDRGMREATDERKPEQPVSWQRMVATGLEWQ